MRTAILSGIHANLQALEAVAADARSQSVGRFVCLGNTVAGGPNPLEVTQWVQENCAWNLRGPMEVGLVFDPHMEGWSTLILVESVHWARREFQRHPEGAALIDWVSRSPEEVREERIWFRPFHQCPLGFDRAGGVERLGLLARLQRFVLGTAPRPSPRLSGDDLRAGADRPLPCYREFDDQFDACIGGMGLHGGIVWLGGTVKHERLLPPEIELAGSLLAVIGNVGMPRDQDPRAAYAIMDDGRLTFRRVVYDIEAFAVAAARTSLPSILTKVRRLARFAVL